MALNRKTSMKRSTATLKKSPLKKKQKTQEQKKTIKDLQEADRVFYESIWHTRGPRSEISGTWLGIECNKACCDHLLEKSKYPHLRYEPDNILLVTVEEHSLKTNSNPLPLHKKAIEKAKIKFNVI